MTTTARPIPGESDIPMHGWRPYSEIHRERIRAHHKHDANGGSMERKDWDHPIWLAVLTEELGEVARVLCEIQLSNVPAEAGPEEILPELIQLGAMTAAWIEAVQHARNEALHAARVAAHPDQV